MAEIAFLGSIRVWYIARIYWNLAFISMGVKIDSGLQCDCILSSHPKASISHILPTDLCYPRYYASIAMALLWEHEHDEEINNTLSKDEYDICEESCLGERVSFALDIVDQAAEHYSQHDMHYEANNMRQLGLQVRALHYAVRRGALISSAG